MTDRFQTFTRAMMDLLGDDRGAAQIEQAGAALLRELVSEDDWLEPAFARPDPDRYQQFLLYCDPQNRFSVVSFVWAAGQSTPIHDHTVWGLIGVLRGGEVSQRFAFQPDGSLRRDGSAVTLRPGEIDVLSPAAGDIHKVSNLYSDRTSISIHVYGADIGRVSRSVFDMNGARKTFTSGYANPTASR